MKRSRTGIYQSERHLLVTFFFVAFPFVFLWIFASFAGIGTSRLFGAFLFSTLLLLVAYVIAALLGWTLALYFYKGRRALVVLPIFDALQSFPTFALLPLATYLWGASKLTVIFFLIVTVIWPIFFSVVGALKLIRKDWEDASQIVGLKGFPYLRYFLWPVSVPGLVNGSIVGLGEGWEALVGSEIIVGVKGGLGGFFSEFAVNPMITFLGVAGFLLFVFSINKLIWLPLLEKSYEHLSD